MKSEDTVICKSCAGYQTGHKSEICNECRTVECEQCREAFTLNYQLRPQDPYVCKECRKNLK